MSLYRKLKEAEIVSTAQEYYDRLSVADALQIAYEKIEEWDYASDPHGYCHDRPVLLRLAQSTAAVTEGEPLWWCEEHKCSVIDGWGDMCAYHGLMLRDTGEETKEPCRMVSGVFVRDPKVEQ